MAAQRLLLILVQLAIAAFIVYRVGNLAGWWTSPHDTFPHVHSLLVNTGLVKPRACGYYNATEFVLVADRVVVDASELRWAGGMGSGYYHHLVDTDDQPAPPPNSPCTQWCHCQHLQY